MRDVDAFLGKGKILKIVLALAIPSFLAQAVNVLYSIVDRIYIGNMADVGSLALAGIGICAPIVTLISSFAFWVGLGGAPLLSIKLGQQDREGAKRILSNCFVLLLGFAVALTIFTMVFADSLLNIFGASEAVFGYAHDYLMWYAVGTLFAVLSMGLNAFIVAQGFGKVGMFTVLIGAIINIGLDPVFIFALGMGVKGAALATVIAQAASAIFTLCFLSSKHAFIRLSFGGYKVRLFGKILLIGLSPFLIIATDSVVILVLNWSLLHYGGAQADFLLAGATIMLSFIQIVTSPLGGITSGTQSILGYNYGAGNIDRVKKAERWILLVCLIFTSLMFLFAQLGGAAIFARIFTRDEAIVALSVRFIKIFTLMIIPLGVQYMVVDGLTGVGKATIAVSLSMFRKLVLMLGCMLILPPFFGVLSVLYAEPIADLGSAIVSGLVYIFFFDKILKAKLKKDTRNIS